VPLSFLLQSRNSQIGEVPTAAGSEGS
jgi:hypothetical protein